MCWSTTASLAMVGLGGVATIVIVGAIPAGENDPRSGMITELGMACCFIEISTSDVS